MIPDAITTGFQKLHVSVSLSVHHSFRTDRPISILFLLLKVNWSKKFLAKLYANGSSLRSVLHKMEVTYLPNYFL